jgi:hypothetical protein
MHGEFHASIRPEVWRSFVRISELSDGDAKIAVSWGRHPQVRITNLRHLHAVGLFIPETPNFILLDSRALRRFEQRHTEFCVKLSLEAVVLHELVHWGYWRRHHRHAPAECDRGARHGDRRRLSPAARTCEKGEQFEQEAYGFRPSDYFRHNHEALCEQQELDQVLGPLGNL